MFAALPALLLASAPALADDDDPAAPPKVEDSVGGPAVDNKTEAAEKEESGGRKEGWSPGIALGAGFNLIDNRAVVGQQEGTTVTIAGGLDAALEFNADAHEWRNSLLAALGTARTPTVAEFLKTNDGLAFESIYLYHALETLGPFARFALNTQMLPASDIRATAVNYAITELDGTVTNLTGRRLSLTNPFEPLTLKQSLGAFWQPLREDIIELEARAGLGAQETLAEGGYAITDDDTTEDLVEVTALRDSYQVGGEAMVNAWGFFDPGKRISYNAGLGLLIPFATSDLAEGDDRKLVPDLITVEARAGINVKLFDWASLSYKLAVNRQPLIVDAW
ncbi:MAG: DUF3078 domain-containing protein, partial [Myxococcales bacterium]|nr:DUF3078 domain-containing protein [Myxococcales bacterium]